MLTDRLVIIEDGRVTQSGAPGDVAARPATRYVADLVGINLVHGRRTDAHTVTLAGGAELTVAEPLPSHPVDLAVAIRPQAVAAEVTPAAVALLGLVPGAEVWAAVKAVDIDVYER